MLDSLYQPVNFCVRLVSMTLQETRQGAEAASVSGRAGPAGAKRPFQGVGQWRLPWKGADPSVSVTGKRPLLLCLMHPLFWHTMLSHASTNFLGVSEPTCVGLHAACIISGCFQDPHSFAAAGLHPFTEYSCSVQAGNSEGFGDWSNTASVCTAAAAPSAPTSLQAQGE